MSKIYCNEDLNTYLNEIKKIPVLTKEELNKLLAEYRAGNLEAKKEIIERNLKLVVLVASSYKEKAAFLSLSDLIQEGNLGLIRAIETYNEKEGAFSTYAAIWIKQSILRALDNNDKTIRRPVIFLQLIRRYKKIYSEYLEQNKQNPTDEYIMDKLGITKEKLQTIKDDIYLNTISLNRKINADDENSDEIEKIIPTSQNDYDNYDDDTNMIDYCSVIKNVLKPRQYYIIYHRFLSENKMKQREIGEKFNISAQMVGAIVSQTIKKIKNYAIRDSYKYNKQLEIINSKHKNKNLKRKITPIDPVGICMYLYLEGKVSDIEYKMLYLNVVSEYVYTLKDLEKELLIDKKKIQIIYDNLKNKIAIELKTPEFEKFKIDVLSKYDKIVLKLINNPDASNVLEDINNKKVI